MKKAQVSIFIILGLVLLISVILFFALNKESEPDLEQKLFDNYQISQEEESIQFYVRSCADFRITDTLEQAFQNIELRVTSSGNRIEARYMDEPILLNNMFSSYVELQGQHAERILENSDCLNNLPEIYLAELNINSINLDLSQTEPLISNLNIEGDIILENQIRTVNDVQISFGDLRRAEIDFAITSVVNSFMNCNVEICFADLDNISPNINVQFFYLTTNQYLVSLKHEEAEFNENTFEIKLVLNR